LAAPVFEPSYNLSVLTVCQHEGSEPLRAYAGSVPRLLIEPLAFAKQAILLASEFTPLPTAVLGVVKDYIVSAKATAASGSAGHVLLEYKSGGKLLTSATHWIELQKLDVSEAALLQAAQNMSATEAKIVEQAMSSGFYEGKQMDKASVMQSVARKYVQQSAPSKLKKTPKSYLSSSN